MELKHRIEHRNVKHPRLEFKGLELLVILPHGTKDAATILEKRAGRIRRKWSIIQEAVKNAEITGKGFMIFGESYTIEEDNIEKPVIDHSQRVIKADLEKSKHRGAIKHQLKNLLKMKIEA